jgi:hypothetical protein
MLNIFMFLLEKNSHLYMEIWISAEKSVGTGPLSLHFDTLAYQAKFRYGDYTTTCADNNL